MGNKSFVLDIESLSYGGRGVGKTSGGKVVFVPFVIPGERVCVKVEKEHSSFIEASLVEIITPVVSRINPVCEKFSRCGGCTWQHIVYDDQLKWKYDILLREIAKVCKTVPDNTNPPQPSSNIYGYRCHARMQCSHAPDMKIGFFVESSKTIVPVRKCPVLVLPLQKILDDLTSVFAKHRLPEPYEIDIRAPEDEVLILIKCKGRIQENHMRIVKQVSDVIPVTGVAIDSLFGKKRYVVGESYCSYAIPAGDSFIKMKSGFEGFIQANTHINCEIIKYVASLVSKNENLLDLYCGNGNFSLPAAHIAKSITAIDNNKDLIQQAKIITHEHRIENIKFHFTDVHKFLKNRRASDFDTMILDPPREGAKDIMGLLEGIGLSKIIYISCNPNTMARDIRVMLARGFRFKGIKLFDMFPHTYHIESVAYLER